MEHRYFLVFLLLAAVAAAGCSDMNSAAPGDNQPHPVDWQDSHYEAGRAIADCIACHGSDLHGGGEAPSCFTSRYHGQSCHSSGPADHLLDGSFRSGTVHGPVAKADLTVCQKCHGNPGGAGSNPRFNIGIDGNGCEDCHGAKLAHPAEWAGPNDVFHYSAGNIQKACTLCHGKSLDGVGGEGISCLFCHDSTTAFTLDCTVCHGYPPDGAADEATDTGVDHGDAANVDEHGDCSICHGMRRSFTEGSFTANGNYKLLDKAANTAGDHWDGKIDMDGSTGYNPANFGCDDACHPNNAGHRLSSSGLDVDLNGN